MMVIMHELVGQAKFDDWAQLAIFALVIVGTLIANAVKAYADRKRNDRARPRGPVIPPVSDARPPRQIHVEPQPLTPQEQMQAPPIAPPAPSVILRPDTQSELDRLRERARRRQSGEQFVPPPPPGAPSPAETEARRAAEARPASVAERAAQEARHEALKRRRLEQEQREAMRQAKRVEAAAQHVETLDEREARHDKQRAHRLGHVAEGVVAPEHEERPADSAPRHVPLLTPRSLRDAIILSEIISPPLSIRD